MDDEDIFHLQLGKTIQAWLWVEGELYLLYAMFMRGANPHLVSVTFNNIQSVDSKLGLLRSCFALVFAEGSKEQKAWRSLFSKAEKLNKKRNKVVHEPVSILVKKGRRTISLGPSFFNAMALVKGQTTHKGGAVISPGYQPEKAKLLQDHCLDRSGLASLERTFKSFSLELRNFREQTAPTVVTALEAVGKRAK